MANLGCILGCITVSSANYVIDVTETTGGAVSWSTSIATGDYFPDSGTGAEDLAAVVAAAMTARSAAVGKTWTYTCTVSATTGQNTITASGGDFELDITGNSDSIFIEMGFGTVDVVSAASSATSTTAGTGTWYPTTPDGGEELISDTRWGIHREGVSTKGCTGKRYTRQWGSSKMRTLSYGPVVGPNGFAYPNGDIDRAATCYENHWCKGKRVRVYTSSRVITTAVDHDEIFEATVLNDDFDPRRHNGHNELDWWDLTLEFGKYVS